MLVLDEVGQVGPRSFLKLLELQAQHDLTIKGLEDREQCQAIEAGDTVEIMNGTLPQGSIGCVRGCGRNLEPVRV